MTIDLDLVFRLVIASLASARVTNLLIQDTILDTPRAWLYAWLLRRDHTKIVEGLQCPWCLGFWVAALWTVSVLVWPIGATAFGLPWSVSMFAWWLGGTWLDQGEED